MHSSRMRTNRLLTVCLLAEVLSCCSEGSASMGCASMLQKGGVSWMHPPPCGQTDAYENITFPHTPYAVGNNSARFQSFNYVSQGN